MARRVNSRFAGKMLPSSTMRSPIFQPCLAASAWSTMQPVRSCCQALTWSAGTILSAATSMYSSGSVANCAKKFSGRSSLYFPPNHVMHHVHHAGHSADLFAVVAGEEEGERDAVAGHDPQGRVGRALVDVEPPPDGHHDAQQKQRKRDAQRRQHAATAVAKRVPGHQLRNRHLEEIPGPDIVAGVRARS